MRRRRRDPLLCELHAHTRWSDGAHSVRELVDLYGRNGFDVLCITDHLVRVPEGVPRPPQEITVGSHGLYMEAIETEAARGRLLYDLLGIPGLELTYEDDDPCRAGHAVAVGLRQLVDLEAGLDAALEVSRAEGAALPLGGGAGAVGEAPRPPRALQPPRALRLGRRGAPAGGGHGRLPPGRASAHVEDAPAVCQGGGGGDRLPPLGPPRVRRPPGRGELQVAA